MFMFKYHDCRISSIIRFNYKRFQLSTLQFIPSLNTRINNVRVIFLSTTLSFEFIRPHENILDIMYIPWTSAVCYKFNWLNVRKWNCVLNKKLMNYYNCRYQDPDVRDSQCWPRPGRVGSWVVHHVHPQLGRESAKTVAGRVWRHGK